MLGATTNQFSTKHAYTGVSDYCDITSSRDFITKACSVPLLNTGAKSWDADKQNCITTDSITNCEAVSYLNVWPSDLIHS